MMTKDAMISRMREKGLKVTPQRVAVVDVLIALGDSHPGASLVYQKAKRKRKSLSLSTTYAALNELSRHGLIKMLQFDKMEDRYDGNLEEHINLICERCKKILDYDVSIAVDPNRIMKKTGFSVTDSRLEYYGLCRECRKAKGNPKG